MPGRAQLRHARRPEAVDTERLRTRLLDAGLSERAVQGALARLEHLRGCVPPEVPQWF